jgi:hypothetical protein
MDIGSKFWAIATIAGPVLLGLAILWGVIQYRRRPRDPAIEAARKEAVHELYHGDAGQRR